MNYFRILEDIHQKHAFFNIEYVDKYWPLTKLIFYAFCFHQIELVQQSDIFPNI